MSEEEAVVHYRRLVYHYAHKMAGKFEVEDLAAEGFIAVIKALRSYDPEHGASLDTHVSVNIKYALLKSVRHGVTGFYVPHHVETVRHQIYKRQLGNLSAAEIAEQLDITESLAARALLAYSRGQTGSLDKQQTDDEEDGSYMNLLAVMDDLSTVTVEEFLASLPVRYRIVARRASDGIPQHRIAAELGVSQMSVSRYLKDIGRRYKEEYA